MRKMLYLVRYCKAAGQQPEAALTADGHLQLTPAVVEGCGI
jgi:hypothetical protein